MNYNFDVPIDRVGTNCSKWDNRKLVFGTEDVIPMWVADMDFAVAEPITAALNQRIMHPIYGYHWPSSSLINAIVRRLDRNYGWRVSPEWLVFTPGVIPALAVALRAFTHPGDAIVLNDPVYHPFWNLVPQAGCRVSASPLRFNGEQYKFDLEDLERRFTPMGVGSMASPQPKAMLLCNPHNPVGRVWEPEELKAIGKIVIGAGGLVISDEVHCELLFDSHRHTPFAMISDEFAQNSIVCMSASKTFNLAGLAASVIIIPNSRLRAAFQTARSGLLPQPDILAMTALETAFQNGDEWLNQVLVYLQANLNFLCDFFKKYIPEIKVIRPQGTYLVWLDCRNLKLDSRTMRQFFITRARIGLDEGCRFGSEGEGFMRMNIACPRIILQEALERIRVAVANL